MIEDSLSRRYSKALFELARESGQEESIGDQLEMFLSASTESRLGAVLSNPGFALDSRKKILLQVAKTLQLSSVTEHFLSLLLDRDRLAFCSCDHRQLPASCESGQGTYRRQSHCCRTFGIDGYASACVTHCAGCPEKT